MLQLQLELLPQQLELQLLLLLLLLCVRRLLLLLLCVRRLHLRLRPHFRLRLVRVTQAQVRGMCHGGMGAGRWYACRAQTLLPVYERGGRPVPTRGRGVWQSGGGEAEGG